MIWQEELKELLAFHEGKIKELGQRTKGRPKAGEKVGWSTRDTAKMFDYGHGTLCELLELARVIDNDEDLKGSKTLKIALAKLRVKKEEKRGGS